MLSGSNITSLMMNKIPDRWQSYSAVGQPIPGTRFIAFKVPLKEELCRMLRPFERFTPSMLRDSCPRLGLVVDLTNTMRYYNRKEFIYHGIDYEKIMCPGKIIPPAELVDRFFEIVDAFLERNKDPDSLIGVHCTHGLNRTSYFLCSYMIRRMGFEPEAAISAFERARGHTIERLEYLQELWPGAVLSAPLPPPRAAFPAPPLSVFAAPPGIPRPEAAFNGHRPRFPPAERRAWEKVPYRRQHNAHPYDRKPSGGYQQSPLDDLYGAEPSSSSSSSSGYGRGKLSAYGDRWPRERGDWGQRRPEDGRR